MKIILYAIPILVIIAVISFSSVAVIDVMGEMNSCRIWIEMNNDLLNDEEFRDNQVGAGFGDYPNTSNEGYFKIRFHADFYQCDRWWDYDQVLDDILNGAVNENYFDDMFWRSNK